MSKASDIAAALAQRLEQITVANGYATDIGEIVLRGMRKPDQFPCVILVEGEDEVADQKKGEVKIVQPYFIEAHLPCNANNPNDAAHDAVADIKRCIFGGTDIWPRTLVRDVSYGGRTISPREDGSGIVSVSVEVKVTFSEDLANP